jgi:hypothetical protein
MAGMGDLRKKEDAPRRADSVYNEGENRRRKQPKQAADNDKSVRLRKAISAARHLTSELTDWPAHFRRSLKGSARTELLAYKTEIRQLMRESEDAELWPAADKALSRINNCLKSAEAYRKK